MDRHPNFSHEGSVPSSSEASVHSDGQGAIAGAGFAWGLAERWFSAIQRMRRFYGRTMATDPIRQPAKTELVRGEAVQRIGTAPVAAEAQRERRQPSFAFVDEARAHDPYWADYSPGGADPDSQWGQDEANRPRCRACGRVIRAGQFVLFYVAGYAEEDSRFAHADCAHPYRLQLDNRFVRVMLGQPLVPVRVLAEEAA